MHNYFKKKAPVSGGLYVQQTMGLHEIPKLDKCFK